MARFIKWMAVITALLGGLPLIVRPDVVRLPVDRSDTDALILAEGHIEPTLKGVTAFLQQVKAEFVEMKKAEWLITQLGDKKFRVRETAMRGLIEGPVLPLRALELATTATDPEIASRAKQILTHPQVVVKARQIEGQPRILAAVFRTIQAKSLQGLTTGLFEIIPLLEDPELLDLVFETIAEIANTDDAPLLERSLVSKHLEIRIAAIRGLAKFNVKMEAELRTLMNEPEPRLSLAAAHTLAQRGDRAALTVLVRLASSKEERVRVRCEEILRAWTGRNFGHNPFQDLATQQENLLRWKNWVTTEGRSAKLNSPLRLVSLPEDLRRDLLLHYRFDEVVRGQVIDSSEYQRHGHLKNEHSLVIGVVGKALEVRGAGEMGDQGGHVSLPFIDFRKFQQFTVSLWVYERGMSEEHGEAYVVFGTDREVGLEDSLGISHFNNNIYFRGGSAWVQTPFDKGDLNRWVHYAITYQEGQLRAFKDGKFVGKAAGPVKVVGNQAALGRHWWHHGEATSTRLIGAFDEFRIYQRALSTSQIEQLHASPDREKGKLKSLRTK